jgi:hypothetical protein
LPRRSPGETQRVRGFARHAVKGSPFASWLPDRFGRIRFTSHYGLVFLLRLLPTFTHGNAVTLRFRLVTSAWKGLQPFGSNAFTGALGFTLRVKTRLSKLPARTLTTIAKVGIAASHNCIPIRELKLSVYISTGISADHAEGPVHQVSTSSIRRRRYPLERSPGLQVCPARQRKRRDITHFDKTS